MKKILNVIIILLLSLCLCSCGASNNQPTSFEVVRKKVYKHESNVLIEKGSIDYSYLNKRGVMGVDNEDETVVFPFYNSKEDYFMYGIDSDFAAPATTNIYSNQYDYTLNLKALAALYSADIYLHSSLDDYLYTGLGTYNNIVSKLKEDMGENYIEFTKDDFRYASQIALHIIMNHFQPEKLVRIDEYVNDGKKYKAHSELDNETADTLYKEIESAINIIIEEVNEWDVFEQYSDPYQNGNGFSVTFPSSTNNVAFVLPVNGDIQIYEGSNFGAWIYISKNKKDDSYSLLLNSKGVIPIPENSGIEKIEICNKDGSLCDDVVTFDFENRILTSNAEYIKVSLSNINTYNEWVASKKNTIISLKSDELPIYYVDIIDSVVTHNYEFKETKRHIQEMLYPSYYAFDLSIFNINFS